ncbi:hypothetical protein DAI43_36600 [Achromobacter xylosoxidans]|nr:hypothetical protein DAI43_36600 [Achromobacter xylosoxidans]
MRRQRDPAGRIQACGGLRAVGLEQDAAIAVDQRHGGARGDVIQAGCQCADGVVADEDHERLGPVERGFDQLDHVLARQRIDCGRLPEDAPAGLPLFGHGGIGQHAEVIGQLADETGGV